MSFCVLPIEPEPLDRGQRLSLQSFFDRGESRTLKHCMFQVSEFRRLGRLKHSMFQPSGPPFDFIVKSRGKPNLETLHVPSFGIPEARKLETLNVSTFRPRGSEFERQNLRFALSNSSPKIPTFEKVGISRFYYVLPIPAEN